uniref:Xanthine dehydrogenase n=1 Tax=Entomoneis paludosa TaxID=265537 RepID=A0A7S2YF81_9STRA
MTLLSYLRTVMGLTGSKLGCAEGGCGACTVLVSHRVPGTQDIRHASVNACLMPVLAAHECHVTTVEGVGSVKNDGLHPVQKAMVDMHGSQCGFCTPGIIVSLYTLLSNQETATVEQVEEHLDGNLCRCTGYRPIWDAAKSLTIEAVGPCGTPCRECPERDECEQDCNVQDKELEASSGAEESKPSEESICCTSSEDKMKAYQKEFKGTSSTWRNQPDEMFPEELKQDKVVNPLLVVDSSAAATESASTWIQPTTFSELLRVVAEGNCKLVVGNTEVGIEVRFKHALYPKLVHPASSISELFQSPTVMNHKETTTLSMGSCCPLSTIQHECGHLASDSPDMKRTCQPIHDMLRWFASTQIRNVACLGGNLVTASPISDMNPLLASMNANLVLASANGLGDTIKRRSCLVSDFFLKYRTVALQPGEVVESVEIPLLKKFFNYVYPFKQARRREDDISIVTAGMRIELVPTNNGFTIQDIAIAFGGMAPTTVMAPKTAEALIGQEFCELTFNTAGDVLLEELALPEAVPGGQAAYRMTLAASFLKKFYLSVLRDLHDDLKAIKGNEGSYSLDGVILADPPALDESEQSGTRNFLMEKKPNYSGVQQYPSPKVVNYKGLEEEKLPPVQSMAAAAAAAEAAKNGGAVGKAVTHQSGPLHCTGEALYVDDIPTPPATLHASLVLSKECGRVFKSVAAEDALAVPGVAGFFSHQDLVALGGNNNLGPILTDEVVFLPLGEVVRTVGQVLGIVVGDTLEAAELGARKVGINYEDQPQNSQKIIVTVQDAIEANSFYENSRHVLARGDVAALDTLATVADTAIGNGAPKPGDIVKVSGQFHSGAQEHFYLETQGTLVVPSDGDTNLTVYCSSQAPTKTQTFCAAATGTPAAKVAVRVKRMGGGFGGKETRSVPFSAAVAVAAKAVARPVKLILPRDVDMKTSGTRHVFVSKYQATAQVTEDGGAKLMSLDIKLFANGGCGFDLSGPVVDRALFHSDGCYNFPNFRCEGVVCKTVQAPHTAYRGFGGPQGIAANEHVLEHLALACNVPIDNLRRSNMYKNGDSTHFGMIIGEEDGGKWNIPVMWDRMYTELNVQQRREEIKEFNEQHKYIKRGLTLLPTKFGIAYTAKFMNQGGSLVHLYTDGTVLVSHGGTEMGQGLHTKVCQVAAQAFGIPVDDVYVNDSSTDKVANTIPTAASMSTDTYGMATLDACRQILERLEPIRKELGPNASLKEIAKKAHFSRVDLSAHGFFALMNERCGFDFTIEMPPDFPVGERPWNSWKGHPFNYFTQGVACTEVEVDLLTGNHRTLRSDLMVDVGSSINPAIDIGQIEGAFTQGMGWSTIEDVVYGDDDHTWIRPRGSLFTSGPGTYKIPAFNDVPEIFNVTLLENVENPWAVHSSKAIGEPPFYLGASVYNAVKDAVIAARKDTSPGYFEMRLPATSERIRMYAADSLALKAVDKVCLGGVESGSFQPQGSF